MRHDKTTASLNADRFRLAGRRWALGFMVTSLVRRVIEIPDLLLVVAGRLQREDALDGCRVTVGVVENHAEDHRY
jgi:hypothetical protein